MQLKYIHLLSECNFGRHFLTKSYSFELLLYLLENKKAEGIEDLLIELKSTTPKLPAFLSYISLLEAKGCIEKNENGTKRSKKTIVLTTACENAIKQQLSQA